MRFAGVAQTIMGARAPFTDDNPPGNCTQAAVATMFQLPLDDVPHFVALTLADPRHDAWWHVLTSWTLDEFGLTWQSFDPGFWHEVTWADDVDPADLLFLGAGQTVRGTSHHVVLDGRLNLVWDPHPSGAGLHTIEQIDCAVAAEPLSTNADGVPVWSLVNVANFWPSGVHRLMQVDEDVLHDHTERHARETEPEQERRRRGFLAGDTGDDDAEQ